MAIPLYYWNDMSNFGDRLNEDVCRMLYREEPIWASPKRCRAVFIGSVLEKFIYGREHWSIDALWIKYFRSKVAVWGSGFIKEPTKIDEKLMRRLDIHAVRGELTLNRLRRLTGKALSDVAIGDPGLLASKLFSFDVDFRHICGIIPHHVELANVPRDVATVKREQESGVLLPETVMAMPLFNRLSKSIPESVVLNPESRPDTVIKKISECGAILSSAMHGLIIADSFSIPNIRIVASDMLMGGDYKFNDYYSAFSRNRHRKLDIRSDIPSDIIESVRSGYVDSSSEVRKIQDALVASFPK